MKNGRTLIADAILNGTKIRNKDWKPKEWIQFTDNGWKDQDNNVCCYYKTLIVDAILNGTKIGNKSWEPDIVFRSFNNLKNWELYKEPLKPCIFCHAGEIIENYLKENPEETIEFLRDEEKIIANYLKENGFDGLCIDDCGCTLDDLMPCMCNDRDVWFSCMPAYHHKQGCKCDFCIDLD